MVSYNRILDGSKRRGSIKTEKSTDTECIKSCSQKTRVWAEQRGEALAWIVLLTCCIKRGNKKTVWWEIESKKKLFCVNKEGGVWQRNSSKQRWSSKKVKEVRALIGTEWTGHEMSSLKKWILYIHTHFRWDYNK